MFERFSDTARQVVVLAQSSARDLRSPHIGTEHLLLGLLGAPGLAATELADAGLTAEVVGQDILRLTDGPGLDDADAAALRTLGIDLEAVRASVERRFGPGALDRRAGWRGRRVARTFRHLPFTPRAKKVLELSLREAIRLRHRTITAEHILLGLLREGRGLAAQVMEGRSVDPAVLRHRIERRLTDAA